ncbi:M23 family metallopeptidase [Bacillus sp. 522_BSPC]|uniref:M23 family metallopeptidase n=1 Tax=Bacillus sp. 522_BSPC TaxID=1579338 RepID=UPI0009E59424|nr:M23 family metallopeptidase [Bacillus sp. 522_BSPC]
MGDYIRRILIAAIMLLFISLLFLGGKYSQAKAFSLADRTKAWTWPSEGIITDTFNTRNGTHKGIDIAGDLGDKVYVVDEGVVTKSYYSQSYGNVIFVKHENDLETVYAHLNKLLVKEKQLVKKGELIGEMGNTGYSSGVHLHFEIHNKEWTITKENAINPILVLGNVQVGQTVKIAVQEEVEDVVTEPIHSPKKNLLLEEEKKLEEEYIKRSMQKMELELEKEDDSEYTTIPYKKASIYLKSSEYLIEDKNEEFT